MSKVYEVINQRIVDLMSKGQIPWVKPWTGSSVGGTSLISRKPYRGINKILTMGFESPYFLTFKQAKEIGAIVKPGAKGTPIAYWGRIKDKDKEKSFMFMKYYTVFNVSQIDGLSPKLLELIDAQNKPRKFDVSIDERAETVIKGLSVDVRHAEQRAYYSPSLDYVNMPKRESFEFAAEFYSTYFHELGHWTGHSSRLNRKELTESAYFGSHKYSQEELTAELTAAFVCGTLGISTESSERNSAAYLQNWLKALKNDSKMLVYAAQRAQKAADLILKIKQESEE